jgi:uncharacterized small protein (DUF1192 family)
MDEDLPKRPREFVLGSDLDRHSIHDLEALRGELELELDRVRRAIAARNDVRSAAEALFKSSGKPPLPDG